MNNQGHLLTRVVTCFRQWREIACWADKNELFDPAIQWIIVNDCPENGCPPELKTLLASHGVNLIESKFNEGRSQARNLGTAAAKSVWIEHIDGDDLPLPVDLNSLPDPAQFDVLQFPAVEVTVSIYELKTIDVADHPIVGNWSTFTGLLSPFNVRPAATMWRKDFLEGLGGYDGRFETAEDIQLALKAAAAGARVWRGRRPKALYSRRPGRDSFPRPRVEGVLRVCRWARANSMPLVRREAELWEAKEVLYLAAHAALDLCRNFKSILRYILSRLGLW